MILKNMTGKLLKILWVVIVLLFVSLQIYNLVRANYADVVISILTITILLAMILAYALIVNVAKRAKKAKSEEIEKKEFE